MEDEEPLTRPAVKNAVNFFNNLNSTRAEIKPKPKPRPRMLHHKQSSGKDESRTAKSTMNLINQLNGELKSNFENKVFKPRFKGGSKEKLIGDEDDDDRAPIIRSSNWNKPDLVSEIVEKPKPLPKPKPRMNILQNKGKLDGNKQVTNVKNQSNLSKHPSETTNIQNLKNDTQSKSVNDNFSFDFNSVNSIQEIQTSISKHSVFTSDKSTSVANSANLKTGALFKSHDDQSNSHTNSAYLDSNQQISTELNPTAHDFFPGTSSVNAFISNKATHAETTTQLKPTNAVNLKVETTPNPNVADHFSLLDNNNPSMNFVSFSPDLNENVTFQSSNKVMNFKSEDTKELQFTPKLPPQLHNPNATNIKISGHLVSIGDNFTHYSNMESLDNVSDFNFASFISPPNTNSRSCNNNNINMTVPDFNFASFPPSLDENSSFNNIKANVNLATNKVFPNNNTFNLNSTSTLTDATPSPYDPGFQDDVPVDHTKSKIETFNSVLILKSHTLNPIFTTDQNQILEEENSYSKSTKYSKPELNDNHNSILIVKSGSVNEICGQGNGKHVKPIQVAKIVPVKPKPKVLEMFGLKNREVLKKSDTKKVENLESTKQKPKHNVVLTSKDIVIPKPKFPQSYRNRSLEDQFEDIDKIFKGISYSPIRNSQSLEDLRLGEKSLEDSIKQTKANIKQSMQCLLEFEKDKNEGHDVSKISGQHFLQAFKKSKRSASVEDRPRKVKNVEPYDTFDVGSGVFRESAVLMIDNSESTDTAKKATGRRRGIYKKIQVNVSHIKERSDAFLEPYLQGLGDRQSPAVGAPSPSPPPACRIAPFLLPAPASRSPSRESLISSNGGSEAGSEDSGDTGYGAACDIGLLERLRRSHPIWFLPGIQRAGAFHLLQGKEEGCFVVRQSSQQQDTMALSVRLPPEKGPYIEHYLIQSSSGRLGLETSENRFDDIPALIAHYATCCDELPVQLTLPKAIREARSRQQLSSYALLGQEFWRYSPPPSASSSPDADLVLNLNPLMSTFKTAEPSTPVPKDSKPARPNTLNLINNVDPKNENRIEPIKCIPSFKNELVSKTPPPPPPRWSKPTTPQNNITVTTTVTFSVNSQSPRTEQPPNDIICDTKRMSPEGQTSTMSSKGSSIRRGPLDTVASPNGSILSPNSDSNSLMTPDTLSPLSVTKTARTSRRAKHKVSKHYQESDILESPTVYYRSAVGDKISDYEDLWTNEHAPQKTKSSSLASPDILQHTGTVVSLNNNILSPTESQTTGSQHSHCSTPNGNQHSSNVSMQSPTSDTNLQSSSQEQNHSPKQTSPFYAEPADSLAQNPVPRRVFNRNIIPVQQRHSNPAVLISHSPMSSGFDKIDLNDFNGTMSSSVDNLSPKQRLTGIRKPEVKPVLPPSIKPKMTDTWQVDNSWKFVGNDADMSVESSEADYDSDWPVTIPNFHISPFMHEQDEKRISIQEMISRQFPDIRMSNDTTDEELSRMSAYDNVDDRRMGIPRAPPSEISEMTEFSDPWAEITPGVSNTEAEDSFSENCNPPLKLAPINRKKSFKDRMDPLLSAPRLEALRTRDQGDSRAVGAAIRNFALGLANDKSTTFAQNIDNFIACTKESREENPKVVMRNMRQFMSGMKNYLVKHGEKGFDKEVERERNKLKSTEFLNIDAILEGVLHCLVVTPLKSHLHKLFINKYTKTGAIRLLADNIQYANTRPISELAIKPKITLPSEAALQAIQQFLNRLQAADSPLEKLEYLLAAIATIFNSVKTTQLTGSGRNVTLGADDFLPLFVWVLVKTNFVAAEIEAEYMWGLLHPSLLSGEGGYYLTTLLSAVHVLKNFKESNEENVKNNLKSDSVLKVVVPDELHGSILTKTLPARPHMTTKEVCKIIAHKARITNPQDFALYRLVDGEETLLGDNECPQDFMCEGKHVMLAYKRIDAKIAWPKQQSNN